MNANTSSRRLSISLAILVAALAAGLSLLRAAETPLKPLYPGITPACSCENLTNLSLPSTTIESAVVDSSNRMCRVTAIVTHPPAGDRVKVWIGLPLTNWNGRFQGTGGGGFLGGHPNSLHGPAGLASARARRTPGTRAAAASSRSTRMGGRIGRPSSTTRISAFTR